MEGQFSSRFGHQNLKLDEFNFSPSKIWRQRKENDMARVYVLMQNWSKFESIQIQSVEIRFSLYPKQTMLYLYFKISISVCLSCEWND